MSLIIKKVYLFTFASFVYLIIYSFGYSGTVQAQQVSLSLDPPIVQAKIKPGKSIIVAYTVHNLGDPINLQFLIRPFTPQGQLGNLSVFPQLEGPVQFNLENADIQMEKPFFFPSKDKKQAVLRIKIPPGIPDGDYYYILLAETVPAISLGGQSTGVASASIGSPLLLSITDSGVTEIKATVAEFSFIPDYVLTVGNKTVRIVDSAKQLPLVCSVRNMGKSLIQPQGSITDKVESVTKKYSIISQNVLSNSQRLLKVLSSEESSSLVGSTVLLSPHTVGTHRVTLELSYGENSPIQYKSLEFLSLPVRLIIITLVSLVVLITVFVVRYLKRKS